MMGGPVPPFLHLNAVWSLSCNLSEIRIVMERTVRYERENEKPPAYFEVVATIHVFRVTAIYMPIMLDV